MATGADNVANLSSSRIKGFRYLAFAGMALISAVAGLAHGQSAPKESVKPLKIVVHVNFGDVARQGHGLKNVENILKSAEVAGIPTQIEVVCHSDGIILLQKSKSGHATPIEALQKKGVRFAACENTMRQRSILPGDLLPGVTTVPSGAFEIVVRQQDGYAYFKP
jgi:intracellular sulfur oxidation DsrE/DsrF family protein